MLSADASQRSARSGCSDVGSALPAGKRTSASNICAATPLSAVDVARCGSSVALSAAPELIRSVGRSCAAAAAEKPELQAASNAAMTARCTGRFMTSLVRRAFAAFVICSQRYSVAAD
ncbi:hypothetical protein D3C87_1688130 [compost metagenome]